MMRSDPPIEVRHVKNLGREKTPEAWAFENAKLLARAFPTLVDFLTFDKDILSEEETALLEELKKIR